MAWGSRSHTRIETESIEHDYAISGEGLDQIPGKVDEFLASTTPTVTIDLRSEDTTGPVVEVVDMLVSQAISEGASDVHIEARDTDLRVRYRVDGALRDALSLPSQLAAPVASRIKVMADMNIVERRRPQDGQIRRDINGRSFDIRVSSVGTVWGEKLVLRILDKSRRTSSLSDLGMPAQAYQQFRQAIAAPFGMIVCAGPTGAGKTTTLYASLHEMDASERNIVTLEEPVEYLVPSVTQIPMNEQAGITCAGSLRAVMRQDPDVIMVGEIRDRETASIGVQAALTGHLVLTSVHANDAVAALFRFLDMGIEGYRLAASVRAVVGQRLVRRNCHACATQSHMSVDESAFWQSLGGAREDKHIRGSGCELCHGSGFVGRVGLFEMLEVDEGLGRLLVSASPSPEDMRHYAVRHGLVSLQQEAMRLVRDGITTASEVMRAVHVGQSEVEQ